MRDKPSCAKTPNHGNDRLIITHKTLSFRLGVSPMSFDDEADDYARLHRLFTFHLGIAVSLSWMTSLYAAIYAPWVRNIRPLIDPMNDAKRSGFNPMSIPFVDNGLSIVTAENADDFYWDKYLKRRGTKGIDE